MHCDIIMQYKPTKCTLFELIPYFNFSIFEIFYMNPRGSKHVEDVKNLKIALKH